MRIVMITSAGEAPPDVGRRADALASYLASHGHTVIRAPGGARRVRERSRIIPISLPRLSRSGKGPIDRLLTLPRQLPWARHVAKEVRQKGPIDVVMANDGGMAAIAAILVSSKMDIPCVIRLSRPTRSWLKPLLKRVDLILLSDAARLEDLQASGISDEKLALCPLPVDPAYGQLQTRRRDARKTLGLAFDRFVVLCPDPKLSGRDLSAIRKAGKALAGHGLFSFLIPSGHLPSKGIRALPRGLDPLTAMAASDAICLAPDQEDIPLSLDQAMSAGRPTLLMARSTSPSAQRLEESGGGTLLTPGDDAALRVATFGLWADPHLARRIGLSAQAWIDARDSVRQRGASLEALLKTLTGDE